MAGTFSLTAKAAVVSSVFLLLSLGLCGIGMTGIVGAKPSDVLFPLGLICLGLGVVGFVVTVIIAIVQALAVSRAPGPGGIAPPPPPVERRMPPDDKPIL